MNIDGFTLELIGWSMFIYGAGCSIRSFFKFFEHSKKKDHEKRTRNLGGFKGSERRLWKVV